MSLPKDTINALTQEHVIPVLNNIVYRDHPILSILMKKRRIWSGKRMDVMLEYSDPDLAIFTGRMQPFPIGESDPVTVAYFTPKMMTVPLAIPLEEELENMGAGKIMDIVKTKVNNLKGSIDIKTSRRLFSRSAAGTNEWLALDELIGTGVCGGITPADLGDATMWQSAIIDVSGAGFEDNPSEPANLLDPSSDVFLYTLLLRGRAKATYMGNIPDFIVVTQNVYDMIDRMLFDKLGGSQLSTDKGDIGFEYLKFRGKTKIIADEDISYNQTSNTDSRIYFLNTKYLYFYFNARVAFKAGGFVEIGNMNASVMKINAYGGMVITNRAAQCRMDNIYSDQNYAAPVAV